LVKAKPKPKAPVAVAKPGPDVKLKIARLHDRLMAEHLRELKEQQAKNSENGGPVLASKETTGSGYGVGPGSGSAGVAENVDLLIYLQGLQKKIKDAWHFAGNDPKLTATVTVGMNPDGSLNSVAVTESSRNPSFDDSVVRAIRLAAPFPAPPEKYSGQFTSGYPVIFNLGELKGEAGSG